MALRVCDPTLPISYIKEYPYAEQWGIGFRYQCEMTQKPGSQCSGKYAIRTSPNGYLYELDTANTYCFEKAPPPKIRPYVEEQPSLGDRLTKSLEKSPLYYVAGALLVISILVLIFKK